MKSTLLAVFLCATSVCSTATFAQTDSTFTYQGQLNEAGAAADGLFGMEFTLFDAMSGGSQVGPSIVVAAQQVSDGVFSSQLDFGYLDFSGNQYWLEIVVEGTALSPRQPITASPYSIQTRGLFVDLFNRVGIGTSDPSEHLHVNGNIQVDGWIGSDINTPVSLLTNSVQALKLSYGEFDDGTGVKPAPNLLGGSSANKIQPGAVGSIIAGGGYENSFGVGNFISDSFCAILGGRDNQAGDNIVGIREQYATAVGGFSNAALGDYSFIGGGYDNTAVGDANVVAGGWQNSAEGGPYNFVGGGYDNHTYSPNSYGVIAGGRENIITSAQYATIPGGYLNEVTADYGFAAGRRAKALHTGSFVWGDSTNADFESTGSGQFLVRAAGGLGLNTNTPLAPFHVRSLDLGIDSNSLFNEGVMIESSDAVFGLYSDGGGAWSSGLVLGEVDGAGILADKWALVRQSVSSSSRLQLTYGTSANYAANTQVVSINKTGQVGLGILPFFPLHMSSGAHCSVGGTWTNASSRTLKENFEPVDRRAILGQLMEMPISRWNYKVEGKEIEHIGPMAEDFAAAFETGEHDSAIATVDADGVAIASIQALYEIIQERDAEITNLNARLQRIEEMLSKSALSE